MSCGVAYGCTSPVLSKMNGRLNPNGIHLEHPVTSSEESWIVGLLPLGSTFGPIFAGMAADKFGRRKTLMCIACPILVGFLILAFAKSVLLIYIARLIMGVGIGSVYMIVPMYVVEISEDHNHGMLSCLTGVFITLGFLYSYSIGPYLSVQNFSLVCAIPLLVFLLAFSIWNPESLHYLATSDNQKQLKISLLKLRNESVENIEKEMLQLNKMVHEFSQNKGGLSELFSSKSLRKALFISIILFIVQQMSAVTAVLSYAQSIFDATGGNVPPEISTVIIGTV